MRVLARLLVSGLVLAATAGHALAQGTPTSQPSILTIIVEQVKPGMDAEHEANEAGWPAAFAKVNSPYYYMAIESLTGSPEVWFMSPYASFAAEGENMKQSQANPGLAAEQARLWRADGQYLEGTYTFQAMARPDLSYGTFPDLSKVRFYEITTMRIRLGHEQGWEAAAKVYMEQVKRAAPGMSYRIYQVTAGMPGSNYLIFSTVEDYAGFDKMMADGNAMWQGVPAKDMATLQQSMTNDFQNVITNRFRVSPTMSYVAPETRASDPSFWNR
jgi:hypothetical protein